MAFRDDRDALLARADALQRDNDRLERELDGSEDERDRLRAELDANRAELEWLRKQVDEAARPASDRTPVVAASVALALVVLGAGVGFAVLSRGSAPPPEARPVVYVAAEPTPEQTCVQAIAACLDGADLDLRGVERDRPVERGVAERVRACDHALSNLTEAAIPDRLRSAVGDYANAIALWRPLALEVLAGPGETFRGQIPFPEPASRDYFVAASDSAHWSRTSGPPTSLSRFAV